ncbi:MAG: Uma2 family endonuclease [Oligoflexia bacterium]|nr:Uma2 family endonuclease [Oligoflexia bacterium]
MSASTAPKLATAADLLSLDPDGRFEILGGDIVQKAAPSGRHGTAQSAVVGQVWHPFDRRPGGAGPGGWWILTEVDIELAMYDVIRPDIAGWMRDRVPNRPTGFPVTDRPDWVCEVLSPSTMRRDLGEKRRLLQQHQVPWYWTVDPDAMFVQVMRWTDQGYVIHQTAWPGEHLGLAPFDAVKFDVGRFFGIEEAG